MCRNVPEMQVGLRAADENTRAYRLQSFLSVLIVQRLRCAAMSTSLNVRRTRLSTVIDSAFPAAAALVNCRNKLYDKSTTNRMELKGYVDRLVVNSHDSSTVV